MHQLHSDLYRECICAHIYTGCTDQSEVGAHKPQLMDWVGVREKPKDSLASAFFTDHTLTRNGMTLYKIGMTFGSILMLV